MQKGWLVAIVLLTVVVPTVLADCYMVNTCDNQRSMRELEASDALHRHYNRLTEGLLDATVSTPEAYPAALYYFTKGNAAYANTLLENQLAQTIPLEPRDALYIAWTLKRYNSAVSDENRAAMTAALDAFYFTSTHGMQQEDIFLFDVSAHLYQYNKSSIMTPKLRERGNEGWAHPIEQHPRSQADLLISLLALYAEAPEEHLRKLAEMNLDLLFTRFGAASVNGAWVAPTAGNTLDNHVYDVERSPWFGWSYLLFGMADTQTPLAVTEPSVLLSGYCAHAASRVMTQNPRRVIELNKADNALTTYVTDEYALGAGEDYIGEGFRSHEGFISKALLRFHGEPRSFLEVGTRTSDDTSHNDLRTSVPNSRVMLGWLGRYDDCQEPYALFGPGVTVSATMIDGAVFTHGGIYGVIRFMGGTHLVPVEERYASRANKLPAWLTENGDNLLYLTNDTHPFFAIEILPQEFVDRVFTEICDENYNDLDCLSVAILTNTSLSYERSVFTYASKLGGSREQYIYNMSSREPMANISDHSFRHIVRGVTDDYNFLVKEDTWKLKAPYGQTGALVTYDFSATNTAEMKVNTNDESAYACEGSPPMSGGTTTDIPDLGYAAASFLHHLAGEDYIIDCGRDADVLPTPGVVPEVLAGSCVILAGDTRSIALVYDTDPTAGGLPALFSYLNTTYSFTSYPIEDAGICDDAFIDSTLSGEFEPCGSLPVSGGDNGLVSYQRLNFWVHAPNNIVVFSADSNPFTTGWWSDSFGDWWNDLWNTGVAGPPDGSIETFQAAFFYHDASSGRRIDAKLSEEGNAEVLAKDFATSVEHLADGLEIGYAAGGTTQRLTFTSNEAGHGSKWAGLTRALRVDTGIGGGFSADPVCGDGAAEFGEACDPPNSVVYACTTGDTSQNVTCDASCQLDTQSCGGCEDLDGDGFFTAGCPGMTALDCYDEDPANVFFIQGGVVTDCTGVIPGDGGAGDPCMERNASSCPQCAHPDRATEICFDGSDNNCDENYGYDICGEPPGEEEDNSFFECVVESACESICEITPECPHDCSSSNCGECDAHPLCDAASACSKSACGYFDSCTTTADCPTANPFLAWRCNNGCCSPLGGGGGCFVPGTDIMTPKGNVAIETVDVGDTVLSYTDGEIVEGVVENVFVHDANAVLIINDDLRVTEEHPFFVDGGWVVAGDLKVGDELLSVDGDLVAIESIVTESYQGTVHNIHVSPHENYFAGGVLVHNKAPFVDEEEV